MTMDLAFAAPIPIFRVFDEAKAREFYLGFLGFSVDFEHRFDAAAPLYMQVSRGRAVLNLSEHHGDAAPFSAARIAVNELDAFHATLAVKTYKYARPGIMDMPWGLREMAITDPFANRLIFFQPPAPVDQ